MTQKPKVVIIGAGLAGLSLAMELVDEGFAVEILEANPYLGGRASDHVDRKTHDPVPIGPHVFVEWYNNLFHFLRKIGAEKLIAWEHRIFIELVHHGRHHKMRFYRLPAPLFLLPWIFLHPLMGWRDKFSNRQLLADIYFSSDEYIENLDKWNAVEYLQSMGVSPRCIEIFWGFIVLSLLNVPLQRCSAAEFAMLVKKWAHLKHRRFGFPKVGLGDVYADEAERYIKQHGGIVRRKMVVNRIIYN